RGRTKRGQQHLPLGPVQRFSRARQSRQGQTGAVGASLRVVRARAGCSDTGSASRRLALADTVRRGFPVASGDGAKYSFSEFSDAAAGAPSHRLISSDRCKIFTRAGRPCLRRLFFRRGFPMFFRLFALAASLAVANFGALAQTNQL